MRRIATELHFPSHDGERIFYRYWKAETDAAAGAVILLHRGHEHGGRMAHLVDELQMPDFHFYAWDMRGLGRSGGERGYAPSFQCLVRDLQAFAECVADRDNLQPEDMAVVAQSLGAVVLAAWAHDYAPRLRAMVLASPAFRIKLYLPFARAALALWHKVHGHFFVTSYVKAGFLTHDRERQRTYGTDPLITRPVAVNLLLGMNDAAVRVVTDAAAISVPTQLLISGSDYVVRHKPQERFFAALKTSYKECHVLRGFFHDTLGEADRAGTVAEVRRFLLERFAAPVQCADLRAADRGGHTHAEALRLAAPLPLISARGLFWRLYRANLRVGSLLSHGIGLGRSSGFDSGATLDYVYENQARGRGVLGRLIDRAYLGAIGWRGIRIRKTHVEELLRVALGRLVAAGEPRRVMDIAAGHGRYVLDALTAEVEVPDSILLRDYSERNVEAGRRLIESRGLSGIASFCLGDAFDRASLAAVSPKPTVGIASGLYELYSENDAVATSLAGLADAIAPGGYLIYTNQPWHPQLEMIARALTSHRAGQAWVMRRRTQGEIDQLVADAGFRKVAMRVDDWGIFTVSLAVRSA